jgi:hypothetical protein
MKILYIFLFSFIFLSCSNKKDIKLPLNDNPGLHEVWDNSPVYILFDTNGQDTIADLKLGQTMSSTHWLVAIDRRLKMKHLIKPLNKILKKRHKKSIHSDGTKKLYFTYMDTLQKKVSFIDFDSIEIMPDIFTSKEYFTKYYKTDADYNKMHVYIMPGKIIINDSLKFTEPVDKQKLLNTYFRHIIHQKNGKKNAVYLNFDSDIDYGRFMDYYGFFKNNPPPEGEINRRIFIFE